MSSTPSDSNWLLQKLVDHVPITIAVVIVVFNLIGHFGNFNLIFATFKSKNLQSKHGILLVILCSEHSLCLLFEFINVYCALTGIHLPRRTCLLLLSPYICISFLQATTLMSLAIDVLFSCTYAIRYQTWDTFRYCTILSLLPVVFPIGFMIIVWSRVSDETIFLCNPPLAMDEQTVHMWGAFFTVINLSILFIYGYVYYYARGKNKRTRHGRNTEKIIRSLTILVLVFCCSWVTCIGCVFLVDDITSNKLVIMLVRSYAVIFAAIAYSQTFYVYFVRSEMYRKEFKKQLCSSPRVKLVKRMSKSF